MYMKKWTGAVLIALLWAGQLSAQEQWGTGFPASTWHEGFTRYDFIMDSATLSVQPIERPAGEGFAVGVPAKGQRRCILVVPKNAAPGRPWSWQGCYWDHEPQTEVALLKQGFCIAFITPDPGREWDAWYQYLTEKVGLSRKPAFVGMSKGGVNEYQWATAHPDKVSCIYADNPALWPASFTGLPALAANDVALLHVCGSEDFLLQQHTLQVENIYHQEGGQISVMIKEGVPHHPHSLRNPAIIADWIVQQVQHKNSQPPVFVKDSLIKSYYYSFADSFHYLPEEKTYAVSRGPLFSPVYERYDVKTNSTFAITGMTILVPQHPAPGRPWVLKGNRVDRVSSAVDLVWLAKGYYVVSPPVTSQAGPVMEQWDAVYKLFTDNGFSRKPVLEGNGAGAGNVYAWAVAHPEQVGAIYAENALMRSVLSKSTLTDELAPLAKAGVPLLHICGSLDPWLQDNSRKVEAAYKKAGGKMKLVIRKEEGHFLNEAAVAAVVQDYMDAIPAAKK
jgi:pimeloyl-ACP methyl ester carboxylesterase